MNDMGFVREFMAHQRVTVGKNLREVRDRRGMNVCDVVRKMGDGYSSADVLNVEMGYWSAVSLNTMDKYLTAIGATISMTVLEQP